MVNKLEKKVNRNYGKQIGGKGKQNRNYGKQIGGKGKQKLW